jgi:hypothetical protein
MAKAYALDLREKVKRKRRGYLDCIGRPYTAGKRGRKKDGWRRRSIEFVNQKMGSGGVEGVHQEQSR